MGKTSKMVTASILSMSLLTVMAAAAIAPAMGIIREHFQSSPASNWDLARQALPC